MSGHEPIGYLASLLVLCTFCMRDMIALRVVAIISNVAFIVYGAFAGIHPVLLLHVTLLPMNAYRLAEALRQQPRAASRGDAEVQAFRAVQVRRPI